MPKKYFEILLADGIKIGVFFETANGLIMSFVVKLLINVGQLWYDVVRFDSAHYCPHKDVLKPNGKAVRKIWYEFLDNKQALDLGIKDLKENYAFYVGRFKKWLNPRD